MEKDEIKKIISSIDFDELKLLREETVKEIKKVRLKDRIKFALYLPKEDRQNYEIAKRWAYSHGVIKKNSNWAFTKFAIKNVIEMIIKEIEKEQAQKEIEELALRNANRIPPVNDEVRQY